MVDDPIRFWDGLGRAKVACVGPEQPQMIPDNPGSMLCLRAMACSLE